MGTTLRRRGGRSTLCLGLYGSIVGVLFFTGAAAAQPVSGPSSKTPFAVIGATHSRGGGRYPPFYYHAIVPSAIVRKEKVYCAFQDTNGSPVVMTYDIQGRAWSEPVYASHNGLGRDAHGNPSICIDRQGFVHVFYGCHRGPLLHARSARPYDITEWSEQSPPASKATYPQAVKLADGSLFLLYRAGGHVAPWCAKTSEDGGATWTHARKIIEMRLDPSDPFAAAYATLCPGADGESVHVFWVHKDDNMERANQGIAHPWRSVAYPGLHEAVYRYNMYYLKRTSAGAWQNAAGETVALPVTKALADSSCLVYDSGDDLTNVGAAFVDRDDRPYIRFDTGVGDWKESAEAVKPWRRLFATHVEGRWSTVGAIPDSWPAEARIFAAAVGKAAFGPLTVEPWFLSYEVEQLESRTRSAIYLYHPTLGFLGRAAGPVELP